LVLFKATDHFSLIIYSDLFSFMSANIFWWCQDAVSLWPAFALSQLHMFTFAGFVQGVWYRCPNVSE